MAPIPHWAKTTPDAASSRARSTPDSGSSRKISNRAPPLGIVEDPLAFNLIWEAGGPPEVNIGRSAGIGKQEARRI